MPILKLKKEYLHDNDKAKALNKIHESDREFIKDAAKEGALGKIASGIMYGKMKAEENNIINSKVFQVWGTLHLRLSLERLLILQRNMIRQLF